MNPKMPFSWRAVFLSPLPIPLLAAATLSLTLGGTREFREFGFMLVVGYIVALGIVVIGLLPALWLLSRFAPLVWWMTVAVGAVEGFLLFFPWDYISWGASGVDSGPPAEPYPYWLITKSLFSWEVLLFVVPGAITAAVYHFLATRKQSKSSSACPP